jgi:hypothetical protein
MGESVQEHDAVGRQGIDGAAGRPGIPIAAQVIRPKGINGDQDNIGLCPPGELCLVDLGRRTPTQNYQNQAKQYEVFHLASCTVKHVLPLFLVICSFVEFVYHSLIYITPMYLLDKGEIFFEVLDNDSY